MARILALAVALAAAHMALCPIGSAAVDAALAAGSDLPEPTTADASAIAEGHSLFNQTCAHCHGPNAMTGLPERNLRHLRLRYGDDMWNTFHSTVVGGRPEKGMPVWGGILDEKTIERIYSYLSSIQSQTE